MIKSIDVIGIVERITRRGLKDTLYGVIYKGQHIIDGNGVYVSEENMEKLEITKKEERNEQI